ncbi:hypothetical protein H4I96_11889 [Botrytis cinerea]
MTSTIVGIDHLLLGAQELVLAIPHLIRPILLTFALFFCRVCVYVRSCICFYRHEIKFTYDCQGFRRCLLEMDEENCR